MQNDEVNIIVVIVVIVVIVQGVTNTNFQHKRIFEYIYIKKTIRTNIRIYSYQKNDTNEYPNIFVSKKWYDEYLNIFVSKKQYERISEYICIKNMIQIWYERIFVSENIWIYEYICIQKIIRIWYERIFVSENIWMYEYIRIKFLILV